MSYRPYIQLQIEFHLYDAHWRGKPRRNDTELAEKGAEGTKYRAHTRTGSLDLEGLKVGDAGFHHVQVHFDEIILYAAGFRGGEDFLPIQSVLSHRHDFLGRRRPALHMHGKEAAGVFGEILRGVVALADSGDLKLELDELGIEKVQ